MKVKCKLNYSYVVFNKMTIGSGLFAADACEVHQQLLKGLQGLAHGAFPKCHSLDTNNKNVMGISVLVEVDSPAWERFIRRLLQQMTSVE